MEKLLLFIGFCSAIAFAQAEEGLTTNVNGTTFTATVKEGFHFNEAAPNQLTIDGQGYKPKAQKPRELIFQFADSKYSSGHASLYVCDDAQTFCEPKVIDLKSGQPELANASLPMTKVTENKYGFIEDNLQAAAEKATKQNKLVLIDFSARWCPGCIRLENEVFNTKDFRDKTKAFVKVRLDYDIFDNLKIAKQYNIRAIPSLLVTTARLEEISRSVDFQPMSTIAKFLSDAKANSLPFAELQKKADAGDKAAALTLGERLYASSQYEKSVAYLSKVQAAPIELLDAKVQAAKDTMKADEKLKTQFQQAVREAIAQEPSSSRSLIWRTDLVESLGDPAEKKKIATEGLAVGDAILAHPDQLNEALKGDPIGEFTGFEKMYVASERADLAESAGLDEATQQAALHKVTEYGREAHIPVGRKGPALRYLIFLTAAKQFPEAETQVRSMIKNDPKNPELQRRLLRVLNGEKKYNEAIQVGRELLPQSFGKNEVWVAQQLAKAYVGDGKKLEAKALAQGYLARKDIDWSMMKSEQKDLTEVAQ